MADSLVACFVFFLITLAAIAVTTILKRSYKRYLKLYQEQKANNSENEETGRNQNHGNSPKYYEPSVWPAKIAQCITVVTAIVVVITFVPNCFTIVPTKEYGVLTSFGRPVGTLSNGLSPKAPWENMTTIDAAIQTDSYVQKPKAGEYPCVSVRIAHQSIACVDVSVRWRIEDGAADALFQNYREFGNIRDSLVTRDLQATLNAVFQGYDALAVDNDGNSTAPSMSDLSSKASTQLSQKIGRQINVESVIVIIPHFDDNTQAKVNALQAQVAQTRIAAQAIITAQKQSEANRALATSVSNDPNVLVSKCLDIVEGGKVTLPAGFTCWPGGQGAVIVPAK